MVIPYALGSDQRQVEFLVQCRNRYVESIGLLRFCTIAEIYGLCGRLQKLCAVLLGVLFCTTVTGTSVYTFGFPTAVTRTAVVPGVCPINTPPSVTSATTGSEDS